MGTVTSEQAIEAVQAISMFNGQVLFDRPVHVKMDDKSVPHEDDRSYDSKAPQLPRGLGGTGMGLGPYGQPISARQLNVGGGMGNVAPSGMGMDAPVFGGMNRIGGGIGFGGLEAMNSMGGFGGVSQMGELYRGAMTSSMERDFGRGDIGIHRGFGDSFGRLGGGMGGMNSVTGGMGMGLGQMSSSFDRMGPGRGAIQERTINMDRRFFIRSNGKWNERQNRLQRQPDICQKCHVMFAEIKMENGRSKGCGTGRSDSPGSAEKGCRIMNGIKTTGREIDVLLDHNA